MIIVGFLMIIGFNILILFEYNLLNQLILKMNLSIPLFITLLYLKWLSN
jgi:hypothetical protein